jgi:uncharacterized protein involved in outer membrane biogenesis
MRWLTAGLCALLLAVVAAVWLLPAMLDWNRYRDLIAALATDTLSHPVRINGNVTLVLLPQPVLTADGVSVAEGEGGATVTARQLRLRVALWPLLSGHVDAQELVLRGVDIRLPWPPGAGAAAIRAPDWLSSLSARIEDGRLSVGEMVFTGIDATLSTGDFAASYLASGVAQFAGRPWRFAARLTRPAIDGSAGVDLSLDGQGRNAGLGLVVTGQFGPDGALAGRVSARGPDMSQLMAAPALPFRAEGRLSIAGGLAVADELTGELGGAPVQGAVALRVAPATRLDVALAASRLDLDAWLPALLKAAEAGTGSRIPVGIDLSAEAAALSGGMLRGLRGAFDLEPSGLSVRDLRAVLPGEASLHLTGRIVAPDRAAARPTRFDGTVSLTAPDLRTSWHWGEATGLVPPLHLPAGVLRNAELGGHLVGEPGQLSLDGLSGKIDGQALSGALLVRSAARPVVRAALSMDRLDLNPWAGDALPQPNDLAALAAAVDLDMKLDVRDAVLHGIRLTPVSLDVGTEPGRLLLRRLDLQALGVQGAAAPGQAVQVSLTGIVLEGGRLADARLDLRARQLGDVLNLLPEAVGAPAGLLRMPVAVQLSAAGLLDALSVRVAADLGDLRIEMQPVLDVAGGKWSGHLTLRHPGAPRLAEALGLNGVPSWLGDGSFSLLGQVTGSPGRFSTDGFDLTAGALHAGGALVLECCSAPRLTGRIMADSLPLPLPYLRSPDPLPLPSLVGWNGAVRLEAGRVMMGLSPVLSQAASNVTLSQGVLRLEDLQAKVAGGTMQGSASLDTGARPPALAANMVLSGVVVTGPVFDLPLDLTSGALDLRAGLTASGYAPAGLLASLAGEVQVTARDGVLAGIDLGRAGAELKPADVDAALAGGSMAFERMQIAARVNLGRLTLGDAQVTARSGTVAITGSVDLPAAAAELRLALRPAVEDPPEIGLRLSGRLEQLARTPELASLIRWRAERGP